ncbi:MAG: 50S ribosomal protein L6 [Candidatus Cloacimonetes bacterium]|nr:50S ribosomal protein L6 [Candidatus Cloacimonadota bacterium]
MSRVGKLPIKLPEGVTIEIKENQVSVMGKLGSLQYDLLPGITLNRDENELHIQRADDSKDLKAKHGLSRALIQNMVTGVSEGFEKILHIIGTGYSAEVIGKWLRLSLGFSHDVMLLIPPGLIVTAEAVPRSKGTKADLQSIIRIKGIDRHLVGQFSAETRAVRPPENYKGKGVRYHDEYVAIKAGKAGSK